MQQLDNAITRGALPASDQPPLAQRPGFLIRRLHQIHVALFYEECAGFDVTPVQSSIITVLARNPGLEQTRLAEAIGVDRPTIGQVVRRLEARGLVKRRSSCDDRRVKRVHLTVAGRALLDRIAPRTARAHKRVLAALPEPERAAFVASLRRLVDANNHYGRALLRQ